jgi:hypothetical protein
MFSSADHIGKGKRSVSFDSTMSSATASEANAVADLTLPDTQSSQDSYLTPGQRPEPSSESGKITDMSVQSSSSPTPVDDLSSLGPVYDLPYDIPSSEINDEIANNDAVQQIQDSMRFHQLTNQSDSSSQIPVYGTTNIVGPQLQIFARILIAQPGDPPTKILTDPYVAKAFRLQIPNNFIAPFYKDRTFITNLGNTAKAILETSFPFPFFEKAHFKYTLEVDCFNYSVTVGKQYYFHRLNVNHLRAMDPAMRDDWLDKKTPAPNPFKCTNGKIFDANYDIVILAHDIEPKHIRTDTTYNESLFVMGINKLIAEKTDAIGTIARILALYHDFRVATLRPPTRIPLQNSEHLQPATAQMFHPDNMPENLPRPSPSSASESKPKTAGSQRPPYQVYVAPHKRSTAVAPPTLRRPQMSTVTFQQAPTTENPPPKVKRKIRNRVVDPTTPWSRTAEGPI